MAKDAIFFQVAVNSNKQRKLMLAILFILPLGNVKTELIFSWWAQGNLTLRRIAKFMPYTEKEINNCGWLWKMSLMQSIDMIVRLKSEINITQAIQHNNIGQNSTMGRW